MKAASRDVWLAVLGALVAWGCDSSSVSAPHPLYSNEPAGYTRIAETNDTVLPFATGVGVLVDVLGGTVANAGSYPSRLLTVVSGANLPVTFPNQTSAQKFVFEAGTPAGYQEAGSDYAGYYLWDNVTLNGANGGPAANEYSAFYQSMWFSVYGNGTNMEVPTAGGFKFYLLGSTYNNLNSSGGFAQLFVSLRGVTKTTNGALPNTFTEFYVDLYTQNFANQTLTQNLNTSKHAVVGQVHHLETVMTMGTDQHANGTVDIWLDGVHVTSYTNLQILNSTSTSSGAPGTAGFDCFNFSPWWGGAGGPAKSRDDVLYIGHTYLSGIFLRNRQ